MKTLIDDIKNNLAEVTTLKYIDEDWGQLDYYSPNSPAKFPCALIDLDQALWGNEGGHTQRGDVRISIRVADMRISNTNVKAPSAQKTKAADFFDLLDSIHAKLHGWHSDDDPHYGPLTRMITRKIKRDDGIREVEVVYQVQLMDDSAQPSFDGVEATHGIIVEFSE